MGIWLSQWNDIDGSLWKWGTLSGQNTLGKMTNVVLYVEFEVLTRYPSRAVLNSFGSGYWRIGLDRR